MFRTAWGGSKKTCDRVIWLEQGVARAEGEPGKVVEEYLTRILFAGNFIKHPYCHFRDRGGGGVAGRAFNLKKLERKLDEVLYRQLVY